MKAEEVKDCTQDNILTKDDLNFISCNRLSDVEHPGIYLLELKDKNLIVRRIGKCDYKKCKNACCKFCGLSYPHEYFEGFGEPSKNFKNLIIKKRCKFLNKNGTCQKWNEKKSEVDNSIGTLGRSTGFPRACEQFPHLTDEVYNEVIDKCTFKYEILFTIDKVLTRTVDEMIENFQEQNN